MYCVHGGQFVQKNSICLADFSTYQSRRLSAKERKKIYILIEICLDVIILEWNIGFSNKLKSMLRSF